MKYSINDLREDFPVDDACLQWLVDYYYPDGITCKQCQKVTKHYKIKGRRSYSCSRCGWHFHPTAGTIYHKSKVPLTQWFYAIFLISNAKAGISSAQISRQLGVTYNTAWRMMHLIRKMMASEGQLEGEVEIDETFLHPNVYKRSSAFKKYGPTGSRRGAIIFGMVERGGRVRVWHVPSAGFRVLMPLVEQHIRLGSTIYSDGYRAYDSLGRVGFNHFTTNHGAGERVNGNNHTQNIENVWSHLKRGIKGVYRYVSPKYLQLYAQEFGFRYSYRNHPSIFWALMVRTPSSVSLKTVS